MIYSSKYLEIELEKLHTFTLGAAIGYDEGLLEVGFGLVWFGFSITVGNHD